MNLACIHYFPGLCLLLFLTACQVKPISKSETVSIEAADLSELNDELSPLRIGLTHVDIEVKDAKRPKAFERLLTAKREHFQRMVRQDRKMAVELNKKRQCILSRQQFDRLNQLQMLAQVTHFHVSEKPSSNSFAYDTADTHLAALWQRSMRNRELPTKPRLKAARQRSGYQNLHLTEHRMDADPQQMRYEAELVNNAHWRIDEVYLGVWLNELQTSLMAFNSGTITASLTLDDWHLSWQSEWRAHLSERHVENQLIVTTGNWGMDASENDGKQSEETWSYISRVHPYTGIGIKGSKRLVLKGADMATLTAVGIALCGIEGANESMWAPGLKMADRCHVIASVSIEEKLGADTIIKVFERE